VSLVTAGSPQGPAAHPVRILVTAIVTLAPTEAKLREDAALMERIARQSERA